MTNATNLAMLPLSAITVVPGFNPRRAFKKMPMAQLVKSIKANGLIQAILVRPDPDSEGQYLLIAGERRFRAAREADLTEVPASIRDCSPEEAKVLAIIENCEREDVSPAEEALAARDVLDSVGDRAAAASALGWSVSKLDARMLLLTASELVLTALAEGSIHVGHAELLAGLPEDAQNKALQRIIDNNVSVADLREQVKGVVIPLSRAIFDLSACQGCPFNTATQRSLFGDAIEGSNCKNRSCFTDKSNAALQVKKDALAEEVGTVALSTEKDPGSYAPLVIEGENGVGQEQFAQCRGCTHFGALIRSKLDAMLGQVDRPICFNRPCHIGKIAAHAEARAESESAQPTEATEQSDAQSSGKVAARTKSSRKGVPTTKAAAKTTKTAAPAASSAAAKTAMKPAYASVATGLVVTDPRVPLVLAILAMSKVLREANVELPASVVPNGKKPEEVVAKLLALDTEEIVTRFRACSTAMVAGAHKTPAHSRNDVFPSVLAVGLAQATSSDLAEHFTVTEEFLAAHTREGILGLLTEANFMEWLHQQDGGVKKGKAMLASKKAELPKAIMSLGFDWKGFVPKAVSTAAPRSFVGV